MAETASARRRWVAGRGRERLLLCLMLPGVWLLVYCGPVSYTESDSRFTLLVSQALIEHGTIRLDAYQTASADLASFYQISQQRGHYYLFYPNGPALVALPAVYLARQLGWNMTEVAQNARLQKVLAALSCALAALLLYRFCRAYLSAPPSALLALVSVLGSGMVSTLGTAFWTTNSALVFTLLCLPILTRYARRAPSGRDPYLLGLLIFGAYGCRPVAVFFALVAFLLVLALAWRDALKLGLTLAALLALLMVHAQHEYGLLLPPYYFPARILRSDGDSLLATLYALTLSPGRGLFVYSPIFLLALLLLPLAFRTRGETAAPRAAGSAQPGPPAGLVRMRAALVYLALGWFILHLAFMLNFVQWWGGYAFGPRLMTDSMPAFVIIAVFVAQRLSSAWGTRRGAMIAGLYGLCALASVAINSYAGLYNQATFLWNFTPFSINLAPSVALDWRYPQFLASRQTLCDRSRHYSLESVASRPLAPAALESGALAISAAAPETRALFVNWGDPEGDFRWSVCQRAEVFFGPANLGPPGSGRLVLNGLGHGPQTVSLALNGATLQPISMLERASYAIPLDTGLLRADANNLLELWVSNPGLASPTDPRAIGIALYGLRIEAP